MKFVLYNIEAVDTGVVMNPHQVRGQVTGGRLQGIGYALQEKMVYSDAGVVINPPFATTEFPQWRTRP